MTTTRLAILEFCSEKIGFSAGHFTIYNATSRERLHGHNYKLHLTISAELGDDGITFDYALFNKKIESLCQQIHSYFLLPTQSPFLNISEDADYYYALFNQEKIPFLKTDCKLLPIRNTTLEELSQWLLDQLTEDQSLLQLYGIHSITLKLFNGPGQAGVVTWSREANSAFLNQANLVGSRAI
jgi:6-pyruvoyltetrahydropterin/6-carboxytetrahydropterin synthase